MSEQHASPIKTPQQLITLIVLSFIVPVAVIILLASYVAGAKREGAGSGSMTPEAVADRLKPVGMVALAAAAGPRTLQSGEAVYKLACSACHTPGVAGAPKTGDAAAWAPRMKQGFDTLVKHAVEGFKAMPAKGGNADLDPIEVARAVAWMGNQSGGKYTEPAAPAAAKQEAAAPAAAAAPSPAASATPAPAAAAPAPAVTVAAAPAAAAAAAPAAAKAGVGEALYKQACSACHVAGVAGAPKSGDKAAWAPRIKLGIDALTASVIKGKGAMPPKGGSTASEADIRAAVEYMVSQAK
jgi:cytochrome c5